jgi:hypothetical protein
MAIPFATAEVVTAVEMNELARAHWRKTTAKVVANTITETDLLNGEITIDAGAMSTNRMLRLTAVGDWINNTGAGVATPRLKLKLGATTIIDSNVVAAGWSALAQRFPWKIEVEIQNLGAANSQWTAFLLSSVLGTASATTQALTTGEGGIQIFNTQLDFRVIAGNSSAVDTTAAQALVLTVTLATANALEDMTLKFATVEIV